MLCFPPRSGQLYAWTLNMRWILEIAHDGRRNSMVGGRYVTLGEEHFFFLVVGRDPGPFENSWDQGRPRPHYLAMVGDQLVWVDETVFDTSRSTLVSSRD